MVSLFSGSTDGPFPPRSLPGTGPAHPTEPPGSAWLAMLLDEIDYGVLLLLDDGQVLFLNHAARTELDSGELLSLYQGRLQTTQPHDMEALCSALHEASARDKRSLIRLGGGPQARTAAVVPLGPRQGRSTTLVVLSKPKRCEALSVQFFASSFGLTLAEQRVLQGLCAGQSPKEVAEHKSVSITTVRTQIQSIRAKTGAASTADLVQQVTLLPPLVCALRQRAR